MKRRLIVVGAGPAGIVAADSALRRGFEVTLLEAGRIGEALERWGPVRFFTPLSMNLPPHLLAAVDEGVPRNALLTGSEFRERVLIPLARETLGPGIHEHHRVIAIGRKGFTRLDYPNHPLRAERPFLVRVDAPDGERTFEAEWVFDATGGYNLTMSFGSGNLPARGERSATGVIRDHRTLSTRLPELGGKKLILVGHGHSAANAVLMCEGKNVEVVWTVRTPNRRPCVEVPNDPLPERESIVSGANALAAAPPPWLRVERRAAVESVIRDGDHWKVTLSGGREVNVDAIAAFTGFRPDSAHLTEIAAEISPVTEGNARLYRAVSNVTDCLSTPRLAPRDLETGEPGFYFIGSRSYGRARTFLLQTGFEHIETILDSLSKH